MQGGCGGVRGAESRFLTRKVAESRNIPYGGDDNAIFSIFRFFIGMDGKFIFLARRRNVAQSTALEKYLLKMGKLFEIRLLVVEKMMSGI